MAHSTLGPLTGISTATVSPTAGGGITLQAANIVWGNSGTADFPLSANGGFAGGGIIVTITGSTTQAIGLTGITAGALTLQANGGNGSIKFTAQNAALNIDSTGVSVTDDSSNTAVSGGTINITANGISSATNINLNADGQLLEAGNHGGTILISDLANEPLAIGSAANQFALSAQGASQGGQISVTSAGGMVVNPSSSTLNVSANLNGGNAGEIDLTMNSATGTLLITGPISATGASARGRAAKLLLILSAPIRSWLEAAASPMV